jgi:hypothetical protein
MNRAPSLLNKAVGCGNYLDGIYVSNSGSVAGPWTKIADSHKLANSGCAQAEHRWGATAGIRAGTTSSSSTRPTRTIVAGARRSTSDQRRLELEHGRAVLEFLLPMLGARLRLPALGLNRCPQSTHPDQHSAAVGTVDGEAYLFVGNGGIYRRPLRAGQRERQRDRLAEPQRRQHRRLQYYAVDIGQPPTSRRRRGDGALVSGGLRTTAARSRSAAQDELNFGGDGGDVLVDPNNGCNILQEYVVLSLEVTQTCAHPSDPNAIIDLSKSTTFDVAPPDINARFIAPFVADAGNINNWLAGGNSIWFQSNGFAIRHGSEWQKVYTFANGPGRDCGGVLGRAPPSRPGAAPATTPASPAVSPSASTTARAGRGPSQLTGVRPGTSVA